MVKPTKLKKAQHLLWSLLSDVERIKHKIAYSKAKANLENGIQETILAGIKINKDAPAALYFEPDLYGSEAMNIVGKVVGSNVLFQSSHIIELLTLYYGNNILNT